MSWGTQGAALATTKCPHIEYLTISLQSPVSMFQQVLLAILEVVGLS